MSSGIMGQIHRIGDLEIDEDMPFQRRTWVFERVGWVVLWAIVAAALLGLVGGGAAE